MDLNNAKYRKYVERLNKDPNNSIYAYKVKKYSSQKGGHDETHAIVSKIDKMLSNTQRGGEPKSIDEVRRVFGTFQQRIEKLIADKDANTSKNNQFDAEKARYEAEKAEYEEQKKTLETLITAYENEMENLNRLLGEGGEDAQDAPAE